MKLKLIEERSQNFTEIYSDHYPVVHGIVYSKIGSIDDTNDIAQEVFIRFFEKFDEVENPRKWLYGTIRNVVLEFYKKRYKKDIDIDTVFDDNGLAYVNGFRDTRLMIQEAIENMDNFKDEREKTLFDLIAVHNFTYKEAGAQVGMTVRQVKYRYNLIVDRLTKYFNKKGIKSLEDLL